MRLVASVGHRYCSLDSEWHDRRRNCCWCRAHDEGLRSALAFLLPHFALLQQADLVAPQTRAIPVNISPFIKQSPSQDAQDCLMPMGLTSEAVASEYGFSREQQDE